MVQGNLVTEDLLGRKYKHNTYQAKRYELRRFIGKEEGTYEIEKKICIIKKQYKYKITITLMVIKTGFCYS